MGVLQDVAGCDDVAAGPVASLWNIADPIVPDKATPDPIARRQSAASMANDGEIGRLDADRFAGNGRRVAGHRNLQGVPSKARAGHRGDDRVSASLTEISGNDRVWSCDATSGERIAHATIVDRGSH